MMVYFSELATAFMTALVLENLLFKIGRAHV